LPWRQSFFQTNQFQQEAPRHGCPSCV
jgi:hypothetical protein